MASSHPSAKECEICGTRTTCFFSKVLNPEDLLDLQVHRTLFELKKGEFLFREGETARGIWIICNGVVKMYRQTAVEGKPLITRISRSGELMGYRSFFADQPYQGNAEAMVKTTASHLDRNYVHNLIFRNGPLALLLLQKFARDLGRAEVVATNMAYRGAKDRVVDVIYDLHMNTPNAEVDDHWAFNIRRQDLAELAGLTIETTVRVLKELEKDGLLVIDRHQIKVLEPDQIRRSDDDLIGLKR